MFPALFNCHSCCFCRCCLSCLGRCCCCCSRFYMTVVVVAACAFVLHCYDGIMEFEQSLGVCPAAISNKKMQLYWFLRRAASNLIRFCRRRRHLPDVFFPEEKMKTCHVEHDGCKKLEAIETNTHTHTHTHTHTRGYNYARTHPSGLLDGFFSWYGWFSLYLSAISAKRRLSLGSLACRSE